MSIKQDILAGLSALKGDDAERARRSFRHFSPAQMQEQHGLSGQTRARILSDYEAQERRIDKAIAWVKANVPDKA